jgi:hypothetical protein
LIIHPLAFGDDSPGARAQLDFGLTFEIWSQIGVIDQAAIEVLHDLGAVEAELDALVAPNDDPAVGHGAEQAELGRVTADLGGLPVVLEIPFVVRALPPGGGGGEGGEGREKSENRNPKSEGSPRSEG